MFKPLNGRILIKPDESELQKKALPAGIVLSKEMDKEKPVIGTVIAGGETTKAGDRVLFSKYAFDEIQVDGENLFVVYEANVLGIF